MNSPKKLEDLETPCFLVDKDKLENNCKRMRKRCEDLGVTLRPMMKTHKCLEAGVIATAGTKSCISVSTVDEAEFFTDGGFNDILLTIIFTQDKINRLKVLRQRLDKFHLMVDSKYGVKLLEDNPVSGRKWSVFLMIETGDKRSGQLWNSNDVITLAQYIDQSDKIDLAGIYAHDGHSYLSKNSDGIKMIGEEGVTMMTALKQRLQDAGVKVHTIGIGSTPTSSIPSSNMSNLTQLHPGNYIFYDVQQMSLGSCDITNIAGRVVTRVTGHYPHTNRILVDAGFLATSHDGKDKIPNGGSFCMVENQPNLKFVDVNQEVGFIAAVDGHLDFTKYPIGSILYLLPWHSCATAAMHSKYYIHKGDDVIDEWYNTHGW